MKLICIYIWLFRDFCHCYILYVISFIVQYRKTPWLQQLQLNFCICINSISISHWFPRMIFPATLYLSLDHACDIFSCQTWFRQPHIPRGRHQWYFSSPFHYYFFIIVANIFIVPNHIYLQLHPSFGFSPASLAGQNFLPNLPRVRSDKIFLLKAKCISHAI